MDRGKGGDKPEFKDLVTGKCEGRTTSNQITFYRNVGNQGLQFSSVGGLVYEKIYGTKYGPRYSYRLAPARYTGLVRMSPKAKVEAVSVKRDHRFSKVNMDVIRVVRDLWRRG